MITPELSCIHCGRSGHLDLRYLHNGKTYELEYHCEGFTGGCDFYRVLPLMFNPTGKDVNDA